jgi:hypothetical protein
MNTFASLGRGAALIVSPLFLCACLSVQVVRNVDDPGPYLDRVYRQIGRIEKDHPHRQGRAHRLSLLVYEEADRQIVRLTVPLWLVNIGLRAASEAAERDGEWRGWERRYRFDRRVLTDLEGFGPGLLVEVEDASDKVLVWLH